MMFLDNLADSLRGLCAERRISYDEAASLCGMSARFFGDIVRKKSAPSLNTLEKICQGLQTTPDDLLKIPVCWEKCIASSIENVQLERNARDSEKDYPGFQEG